MSGESTDQTVPRRVLIVSASVGRGHDVAGRALHETVCRLWPGSQVSWVDPLSATGRFTGRASRRLYLRSLQVAPWLYGVSYSFLWRHPRVAAAAKRIGGRLAGRPLASTIERFDPDLILSTHPQGTSALAWLVRQRGLAVPVGAWVSDIAPHPMWIHPDIDLHLVMHPAAVPAAAAAHPHARIATSTLPVAATFRPGDQVAARQRASLHPHRPVVLVSCGSLAKGPVERAVLALASLPGGTQLVAVCGSNRRLAARLTGLGLPPHTLQVRDWVPDMAGLMRAADAVVTCGNDTTALEALGIGTPLVVFAPPAGHGEANAALLTASGLAQTCRTPRQLAAAVQAQLASRSTDAPETARRAGPRQRILRRGAARRTGDSMPDAHVGRPGRPAGDRLPDLGLPTLAASRDAPVRRKKTSWPLRGQDAFFRYVQTRTVAQQIGVVLHLGPLPGGRAVNREVLLELLQRRLPALPTLRRLLVDTPRWRRPSWLLLRSLDPAEHIHEQPAATAGALAAALDEFWTAPVPTDRPPWQLLLLTGQPTGHTRLAFKMHHSVGDGLSTIGTLLRLLDPGPGTRPDRPTPPASLHQDGTAPPPRIVAHARRGVHVAQGLMRLATAGAATRSALNRPLATGERRLFATSLPAPEFARTARALGVHASELSCALVAEALRQLPPGAPPARLRAMFAVSRPDESRAPTQGNWTGAVTLDLPTGPMPLQTRVRTVRQRLRRGLRRGEPAAAQLVMTALGWLPRPLHAGLARTIYRGRFMNVIVSYMSATTGEQRLVGAAVHAATPVVALADGVPVGVATLRWHDRFEIGVLLDASLADRGDTFIAALHEAYQALLHEDAPAPGDPTPATGGRSGPAGGGG